MADAASIQKSEDEKHLRDDARLMYRIVVDDIKSAHEMQWRSVNYGIGVLGILSGLLRLRPDSHLAAPLAERLFYAGIGAVVFGLSFVTAWGQQMRLRRARHRLEAIRNFLHSSIRATVDLSPIAVKMADSTFTMGVYFALMGAAYALFLALVLGA